MTHYLPAFTSNGPDGTQLSVCHAWIRPELHSNEPTCPQCQAWLTQDAKDLADLQQDADGRVDFHWRGNR